MKKISLLIASVFLLASCGGGDDNDSSPSVDQEVPPVIPSVNQAPSKVESLIFPTNNLLCTTNTLKFEWSASTDSDGDKISYQLEISKDNQFSKLDQSFKVSETFQTVTLEKNLAYYWRVKATDKKNASADYSNINQFYTEGEGEINYLPFAPQRVAPTVENITATSTNLEWNCSDVDNDILTYDVYFDTVNPPLTKVGDNQSASSLNVNLNPATTYYWKIVAKDNNSGESISQIWSFSTN